MLYQCLHQFNPLRSRSVFVFLLLLGSFAAAQAPISTDNSASASTDGKYVLTGTVVNSVTGEPIPRALVQLYAGLNLSMLTDFSGTFRFEGLQVGSVSVSTWKPGFFTPEELSDEPGLQAALPHRYQVGPNMQPVTLQLVPQGSIVGRVINTEGDSVEDVGVEAYRLRIVEGRKEWQQGGNASTEEDGKFRIGNLPPGVYAVRAGPARALGVSAAKPASTRQFGYPAVFYPASSELTSATLVSVQAGQETEANFSLRPEPLYHISGSITGSEENAGLDAKLMDSLGGFSAGLRFRPSLNAFSADVVRGQYTLQVRGIRGGQFVTSDLLLNVSSDMNGIQAPIGASFSIPVRIRVESVGERDARERLHPRDQGGSPAAVRLVPSIATVNPREFRSVPVDHTEVKENVPQQIREIEPGRYRAEITPTGRRYVQTATCGSTDLLREELIVASGEAVPPIEIVLRDDPGRLTGIVEADQPNTRAAVLLIPENRPTGDMRVAYVTTDSEFTFDPVAPGDYEVLALDRIAGLEYRNPEALAPYRSRAVRVSVPRGGEAKAKVALIRRGAAQ